MHAYTPTAWFLFDFLSLRTYSYSQLRSLVATALHAAFLAVVRCSNFGYNEGNTVPPPRAQLDLIQFRLVLHSANNVVVMRPRPSLQ